MGLVGALSVGATIILRRRFSASEFWDDLADNDVSLFVYIGELCRFLLGAPDHPKQNAHALHVENVQLGQTMAQQIAAGGFRL